MINSAKATIIKSLRTVLALAEDNSLDIDDPDESIHAEAVKQANAISVVQTLLHAIETEKIVIPNLSD